MASKFTGRDYSTLRDEIIEFLRQRFPSDWDYNNLADPVVIYAETLAMIGDQLHYTIDELRRECDISTATRASSIYSYALREGYRMMLPRGSFGTLSINASDDMSGRINFEIKKFDEIKVTTTGDSLYAAQDIDLTTLYAPLDSDYIADLSNFTDPENEDDKKKLSIYARYAKAVYNRTLHLNVVLGKKSTFNFNYSDINADSTVTLPNPFIDRNLIRLQYKQGDITKELELVDDIISSGFDKYTYTLTPKFIGGAITLNIEFPTNYRDIFNSDNSTSFTFEYIEIQDSTIEATDENSEAIDLSNYVAATDISDDTIDTSQYIVSLGNGIKGYSEYEDCNLTREQYKKFLQSYSALLTKYDYANYIKAAYSSYCQVYDHADNYSEKLPTNTVLMPRVIHVCTDDPYDARETMWADLMERSSRSDCIIMTPYGKDPYTIVVLAECYLLGITATEVATQIKTELIKYYSGNIGEKTPEPSVINYIVHKASDSVVRMQNYLVRDTTFGTIDTTFNELNSLSNDDNTDLFNAIVDQNFNFSISVNRIDSDNNSYKETIYPLRGSNVITTGNSSDWYYDYIKEVYYNKYPRYDYDRSKHKFPAICRASDDFKISDYETMVNYQHVYGLLDSPDWDFADEDIFKVKSVDDLKFYVYCRYTVSTSDFYDGYIDITKIKGISENDPETGIISVTYKLTEDALMIKDPTIDSDSEDYVIVKNIGEESIITLQNIDGISTTPTIIANKTTTSDIDSDVYIKHHYMVPVLNNVVVLVNAISK